jgi:hypothetical protein
VLAAVQQAVSAIDAVVAPLTASSSNSTPQASHDDSEGEAEGKVVATKGGKGRGSMYAPLKATRADAYNQAVAKVNEFSPIVEGWQSRVQPKAIEQYLDKPEVRVHGVCKCVKCTRAACMQGPGSAIRVLGTCPGVPALHAVCGSKGARGCSAAGAAAVNMHRKTGAS